MEEATERSALLGQSREWRHFLAKDLGPTVAARLEELAAKKLAAEKPGDAPKWESALQTLQALPLAPVAPDLTRDMPRLGATCLPAHLKQIEMALREFCPWRKGPFEVCGLALDAEWRSNLKFDRLRAHVDFNGQRVLDVGSGNGYYCLRAVGAGASLALGVDPTWLFVAQFAALTRFMLPVPAYVLPFALEELPEDLGTFDCVLSLGVLYHRRAPLEHLGALRKFIANGGKLVLETLIVEGPEGYSLKPEARYAGMRNVWELPTSATLQSWLKSAGYRHVQLLDVTATTPLEQRSTSWSSEHSLINVLDPTDALKTVEGHPAPRRALLIAEH